MEEKHAELNKALGFGPLDVLKFKIGAGAAPMPKAPAAPRMTAAAPTQPGERGAKIGEIH